MDTYSLNNFLVICKYGSINKAAQVLHISQPSLSRQMSVLESELGIKLFERTSSGVRLTNDGLMLKTRAEEIISIKMLLEKDIANKNNKSHPICFGATTSSVRFASDLLMAYKKIKELSVDIRELNTYELINLLINDSIDFAFIRTPFEISEAFSITKLTDDYLISVGRPEYMEHLGDDADIETISDSDLIINRRWKDYITVSAGDEEISLNYKYLCDDNRTAYLLAKKGLGIAILPYCEVAETAERDGLKCCKVENNRFTTGIYIVYRKNRAFPRHIQDFIKYVLGNAI